MNKRKFNTDYSKEPKPVEQTIINRTCQHCGNTYRMSMVFNVNNETICTKCMIQKIEESKNASN